jgi:hypothetical protein
MKTLKVKYTIEVTRDVVIDETTIPPAIYTPEEWEEQQIMDAGWEMEDMLDGRSKSFIYNILS